MLDIGEVRTRLRGRATATHFATFAPIKRKLKVIPDHPQARDVQVGERLEAKLSRGSCAVRWGKASAADYHETLEPCRGCEVGQANHEMLTTPPSERAA